MECCNSIKDSRKTDLLNEAKTAGESNYRIWRRAAEWTKGILSTTVDMPVEEYKRLEGKDSEQQIQNIAILNLKKAPGGSVAQWEAVEAYAQADIELIAKEIEIIDPAIVLFGGTFCFFQRAYTEAVYEMNGELHDCYGMLAGKERLLIDYWHPANYYPAITSYYGIAGIYQAALKAKEKRAVDQPYEIAAMLFVYK